MTTTRHQPQIRRIALLLTVAAVLSACAIGGSRNVVPRQPFADIAVPQTFIPFSDDWALIQSGRVTAARLVYQTELPVERAAEAVENSLKDGGWVLRSVEPLQRAGFEGQALLFDKGPDTCRAEVVPSATTTRIDLTVGRVQK